MSVSLALSDTEAQRLANLADAALCGDGHRPTPCPICDLAEIVLQALERGDIRPQRREDATC